MLYHQFFMVDLIEKVFKPKCENSDFCFQCHDLFFANCQNCDFNCQNVFSFKLSPTLGIPNTNLKALLTLAI